MTFFRGNLTETTFYTLSAIMSSTKRSSPGAEETTTGLLDIPEEDIAKLKGLSSELTALDLVLGLSDSLSPVVQGMLIRPYD